VAIGETVQERAIYQMTQPETLHILAIEARRSRFGYALFEGPKRLLDWGGSAIPSELTGKAATEAARKRITSAFRRCHPVAAVVRRPRKMRNEKGVTLGPIWRTIVTEATALSIPVYSVSRGDVHDAFGIIQGNTKEQIAEFLVGIFPELLTRLPPKRKKWQPEFRGMIIFDAVAVGLAYWRRHGTQFPPPE
jgi:hypothetical protein